MVANPWHQCREINSCRMTIPVSADGCDLHYVPARRKNAILILSAYSNTFAAFWPFRSRDFDRGVALTLGHLEAAFEGTA
jgi:hypothetical protein